MDSDTQTRMFYPAPDKGARRVRGPEQVLTHDNGTTTRRRLYIRTTKVMSFATKAALHLEPMPVTE